MKKLITCAAVLTLAAGVSNANETPDYIKGGISYTSSSTIKDAEFGVEVDFDSGLGVNAAVGRNYSDQVSFELELQHKDLDADSISFGAFSLPLSGSISYTSVMLNTIYRPDFKIKSQKINPYIGFGLGATVVSGHNINPGFGDSINDTATTASYQVMLGNRFNLNDGWFVDTEYRYFQTENFDVSDGFGNQAELEGNRNQSVVLSVGKAF